ncbi:MAG TPA: BPSS1780 family membrane protein [Burkholderiaceae bacterium]
MGLRLQTVDARQGWTWVRDGVRLYLRRPVAFSAMLLLFLLATGVWSVLPVVGLAALASLPLLSLGFMVASRSVLRGGLAHPGQFIEPLRGDSQRRRNLLLLCALYGVGALAVVWWVGWVYGDAMDALREAMSKQGPASTDAASAAADPRLMEGTLSFGLLATLLSIPFWHAPALVWWGGQGVWQALFSSTLGVWRAKAAYLVYSTAWLGASIALSLVVGVLAGTFGSPALITWLVPALVLALSSAFYVSLWFSFVDNFGSPDEEGPDSPQPPGEPASLPGP